jgi:EAL domain-containing protein (putative c-di-GMP-specific phosphodiesterase class I)
VEALARWRRGRRGWWVPAETFIGLAERHGLIGPLSELLLTKALFGAVRLAEAGFPLTIAVNLSVSWLAQPQLPEFILATLRAAGIPGNRVVLEIVETGAMAVTSASLDGLARLRQQGIGITVDGFKPDFMCPASLRRVGFSEFKLGHTWAEAVSAEMLEKLEQARALGIAIAAMGIETADDLERARALRCDVVQGHLIAAAMPVEELMRWLQAHP